jgi:membrane protease subunit HflK
MSWDWDKLQERKQRLGGLPPKPDFEGFGDGFKMFKSQFPIVRVIVLALLGLWLLSGVYIVEPAEVGVVLRFGAFNRITQPGPHYHMPFPVESVITPRVSKVRRVEVGFRSLGRETQFEQGQFKVVPEESQMLTGDENIVAVQFIVQYQIKDPVEFLFNVSEPGAAQPFGDQAAVVKNAAEAAMREVIGYNKIDSALTTGKLEIQNQARDLLQVILDRYKSGIRVVAVQLQDVHPPKEVLDAFKDVASAREDKSRFINEAEAYRNDLMPRTRGLGAQYQNEAAAYKESVVRKAQGEAQRFLMLLKEYANAKDITKERLFLEAMETILANPKLEKVLLSQAAADKILPYLPLDRVSPKANAGDAESKSEAKAREGEGQQ